MTNSSSGITVIPKIYSGLRVLLVEPDETLIKHHAYTLTQNSYRVTSTTKAFMGLTMIMVGHIFDCVLIDADMCDMDIMAFVEQVLKHQPRLSLIMMTSRDIHLRITKETLENEAVMCLLKPCNLGDICNIWKHICRKRIAFQENVSKGILHIEGKATPSSIIDSTMTNNNILAGNSSHGDIVSQEFGFDICKQVTYEDLFSGDDDDDNDDDDDDDDDEHVHEIIAKENVGIDSNNKPDKGKQPWVLERKNDQSLKDDKYGKKRKRIRKRISWKGALHEKFVDAFNALGEQAHSSSILKHMNVPGLTRFQVASHLQKYRLKLKTIKPSLIAPPERRNNMHIESYAKKLYVYSTRSGNDISIVQSPSLMRSPMLNAGGISYMSINNIKARLQEARLLPMPPLTTNLINNSVGDQTTNHSLGLFENFNSGGQEHVIQLTGYDYTNAMEPQLTGHISSHHAFQEAMAPSYGSATVASDYSLGMNATNFSNSFDDCNSWCIGGSVLSETQESLNCFGNVTAPWGVAGGGAAATISCGSEDLALPQFLSGAFPYQDVHVNGENLSQVFSRSMTLSGIEHPINPSLAEVDSVPYALANTDFSGLPNFSVEENNSQEQIQPPAGNSIVPLDGSECIVSDDDLFLNMSQSDIEMTINYLFDDDGNRID